MLAEGPWQLRRGIEATPPAMLNEWKSSPGRNVVSSLRTNKKVGLGKTKGGKKTIGLGTYPDQDPERETKHQGARVRDKHPFIMRYPYPADLSCGWRPQCTKPHGPARWSSWGIHRRP